MKFTGVKVFSATMQRDREQLGDRVTAWLAEQQRGGVVIADIIQTQSSDASFHLVSISVFTLEPNRPGLEGSIKPATPNGGNVRRLDFKANPVAK